MKVERFDYELPSRLIAQRPMVRRDRSRLLVLERTTGAVEHRRFDQITDLVRRGDLLVLNDTRVVPARLVGQKATGGRVELLLVERLEATARGAIWRSWLKASRKPEPGSRLAFPEGVRATVLDRAGADWRVELESLEGPLDARLEQAGRPPLPPYIRRDDDEADTEDRRRYQTVFARRPGAIAAPTAGLHFTESLLARLRDAGVEQAMLTLHVGLGTFQPLTVERVEDHRMHEERYDLPIAVARAVAATRERGGRVIAVGTTVVRTLEQCADGDGSVQAASGRSALFIYPGFRFRVVDAMITNFHLPRSTLLMLVSAFAGRQRLLEAYRDAVAEEYRFYSFGDAMWISDAA